MKLVWLMMNYGQVLHVVGLYDDQPTIIDFKQSNKPKREEYVEDY